MNIFLKMLSLRTLLGIFFLVAGVSVFCSTASYIKPPQIVSYFFFLFHFKKMWIHVATSANYNNYDDERLT